MVELEAPGVEADGKLVGERIGAGEIEIDQPRERIAEKVHVVGKKIGMNDALRQIARPRPLEHAKLRSNRLVAARPHRPVAGATRRASDVSARRPSVGLAVTRTAGRL